MNAKLARIAAGLALLFAVAFAGSAEAAKLYSPPLPVKVGQSLECKILNTTDQTREVRIDIRTDENGLASDMIMPPTPLAPGEVLSWSNQAGACFRGLTCFPSWCRFHVQGSKSHFRASACVRDGSGCRAAVEAR